MHRRTPLMALAAGMALLVSACSAALDTPDGGPAGERVAAAAEATADETARMSFETRMEGLPDEAGTGALGVSGEGELDLAEQRMHLTMAIDDMPDGASAQADASVGGDEEMEILVDGTTAYLRMPRAADQLDVDAEWIRMDAAQLQADETAGFGGQLDWDPNTQLTLLEEAATTVEEVGEGEVRGQQATRYEMTTDLEALALDEVDDPDEREAVDTMLTGLGIAEMPTEVWVDDRDRVVRMDAAVELSDLDTSTLLPEEGELPQGTDIPDSDELPDGADLPESDELDELAGDLLEGLSQTTTIEFFDFGAEVEFAFPDDGDVVEAGEIEGMPQPDDVDDLER
ncbi:hypothetical protein ER308_08165 [Egibacter rhizosphaerae]|uniref:LppX_LprAFG lipoprotein n=1 Tax=Egibacter rhizosphaerae TaxID=1670831 RepID=A0A411YEK6_9ACTN|nr:hypothetical protein [Egibacter rhizosphaerae]QBI19527.1 hypothetical protein ER308_08165 [Egibacter rhizosphaerae]